LELEKLRQQKQIGKPLEATVTIYAMSVVGSYLKPHESSLKELLSTSDAKVIIESVEDFCRRPEVQRVEPLLDPYISSDGKEEYFDLILKVEPAVGTKCGRCWNYRTDTADYGPWSDVCGRCAEALDAMGYSRETGERGVA
jgi:isoleucyl-tRNA synthetase